MGERFAHRAIRTGWTAALLLLFAGGCEQPDAGGADAAKPVIRTAQDGDVNLRVTASKERITVAEPLQLTVQVDAPANIDVRMPQFGPKIDAFNVRGLDEQPVESRGDLRIYRRQYALDVFTSGLHAIPKVTVAYGDAPDPSDSDRDDAGDSSPDDSGLAQLSTDPINIEVTSLLEGEFDPGKFHDVKSVASLPRDRTWVWIYWTGGAILAALLLLAAIRSIRSRVKRARKVPIPLPHEWALAQLKSLGQQDLIKRGEIKTFYYRLSEIVRTYIELRFRLMAPERTTEEFLVELRISNRLSETHKALLGEFLEACDRVKYARHEPGEKEIESVFQSARQFVQQTRPVQPGTTELRSGNENPREQAA